MSVDFANLRRTYESAPFDVGDVQGDPLEQFATWFQDAQRSELFEPNAAVLATADEHGRPSARHVLVKGLGTEGFVFFSNYHSRKGAELAANPFATLVFTWSPLARQVVIEGGVRRLDARASDTYFDSRPRASQLGAWASQQSTELVSRAALDDAYAAAEATFAGRDVPRPEHWGGYLLEPQRIEFWQGRPSRLHDRICYLASDTGWRIVRLAP